MLDRFSSFRVDFLFCVAEKSLDFSLPDAALAFMQVSCTGPHYSVQFLVFNIVVFITFLQN